MKNFGGFLAISLLLLTGCATRYPVSVDALADLTAGMGTRSYVFVSDTPGVEEGDLLYKEMASEIEPLLGAKGYRRVESPAEADLQIGIRGYLSDAMTKSVTRSEPVYLDTWPRTRVVATPVLSSEGKVVRYVYSRVYLPSRSFAGYVDREQQLIVHDKILRLSAARRGEDGQFSDQVWTIRALNRSESTDFRSILPILLEAMEPYIGEQTEGEVWVEVKVEKEA